MEKTTKNLFTVSIVLYVAYLVIGVGVVTLFWDFICSDYSIGSKDIKPVIPITPFLNIIIIAVAFLFCRLKSDGKSILPEVSAIVFLCGVLPVISRIISQVQSVYVGTAIGGDGLASLSIASQVFTYAGMLNNVAIAFIYVALGMRIAQKTISKTVI